MPCQDYLHRGDHPIVKDMSFYVYAMWIFRIERKNQKKHSGHIDIAFAPGYALQTTHMQRMASEFRVPLLEGFTMPSANVDSETASMYKQILLRPTSIEPSDEPLDLQLIAAFDRYCEERASGEEGGTISGANAFTRNWLAFDREQEISANDAFKRFLSRYEWHLDIWNTQEVQETLSRMWYPTGSPEDADLDPEYCHDRAKPRCTVKQYGALVGQDVAWNLEAIASARLEKRPRQYQSDASVHQAYMQATSGGGAAGEEDGDDGGGQSTVAPKPASLAHFEPLPWNITSEEDMKNVLDFKHRLRLTQFAKELLLFPCMQPTQAASSPDGVYEFGATWRNQYSLDALPEAELVELANLQASRMEISHDEADIDVNAEEQDDTNGGSADDTTPECFANQFVYAKPSDYIMALIAKLPEKEKLTRDQTHFMIRFAVACDEACYQYCYGVLLNDLSMPFCQTTSLPV